MKRWIAVILCLLSVFSLAACGNDSSSTPEPTEKKDYSKYAGIVADPVTWVEEFEKLPIANANMTTDELRQLACDAFKANLTFQWTPNKDIQYTYELLDKYTDVYLPTGKAYSGFAYATGVEGATSGTIYKALYYYDRETGVLDVEAMGDNALNAITSACSAGAMQGWNRVSNSHGLSTMGSYTQYKSNIVPVGPYTYEVIDYKSKFNSRTSTTEIIEKNGVQTMFESYGCMLPADGLYSAPSWHVMMCCSKAEVVRNSDGTINGDASYIYLHEQGAKGTNRADEYTKMQDNGVGIQMMGTVDRKVTFQKLLDSGYIPFTLKEFLGEDPVEPGEAWIGTQTAPVENGTAMTLKELVTKSAFGNYVPCYLEFVVKTPDGTDLVRYNPGLSTQPWDYEVPLMGLLDVERLSPYANGKNTIHIYMQLANGEYLEAFNTVLKAV